LLNHYLFQVTAGLSYLHSLNPPLLHRDLKSPNVFLTRPLFGMSDEEARSQPIARIGDFGLSVFVSTCLRRQEGIGYMGNVNPRWVAPEILKNEKYSLASDIYSLGLV
jgi:serine/threonine protein kinase